MSAGDVTYNGTVYFVPYGQGPIASLAEVRGVPRSLRGLPVVALALMLCFGSRRRRGLLLALFAVFGLVGAVGMSGCGSGSSTAMTPGTYPYTISTGFSETGGSAMQNASTTVTLTVQ